MQRFEGPWARWFDIPDATLNLWFELWKVLLSYRFNLLIVDPYFCYDVIFANVFAHIFVE